MNVHEFGLLIIILLLLACIIILCVICGMKVYKLVYGSYEKEQQPPMTPNPFDRVLNDNIDPRTIQTRIKFLRKPYKKMKESQARNMPPIIEVNTPVDSDAVGDFDFEESNEHVSVCPKNGGVTNYWKKDTIIVL